MVAIFLSAVAVSGPALAEAQAAAARIAAGEPSDDASRAARARNAHWAPSLRAQGGGRQDDRTVTGELRLAPIREDWNGAGRQWSVMLSWDFSQVVFAREETQLALAHASLERARREVREKVARLYVEWLRLAGQEEPAPELLRVLADLDGLTGGLFREELDKVQAKLVEAP